MLFEACRNVRVSPVELDMLLIIWFKEGLDGIRRMHAGLQQMLEACCAIAFIARYAMEVVHRVHVLFFRHFVADSLVLDKNNHLVSGMKHVPVFLIDISPLTCRAARKRHLVTSRPAANNPMTSRLNISSLQTGNNRIE